MAEPKAPRREEAPGAEARLRRYLDSSLDMVCTLTAEGSFVEASGACRDMLGYGPDELVGRSYTDFIHPDDRARDRAGEGRPPGEGRPAIGVANRYIRRDGRAVYLHWSAVWSAEDEAFYCVVRDLTEQVRLEEQLSRAQRLEAIGKLTGGVAHDFNNLLTIILGSAEGLVDGLAEEPRLRELAELVQAAAERGASLTSRLLAFARRQPLEPRALDAPDLAAAMLPMVRRTLGEDIEVEVADRGGVQRCLADPAQLESAILNLCINARDAMPFGGRIVIETAPARLEADDDDGHEDIRPGDYVRLSVIDDGEGMSREIIAHAFEPFFTTKPPGRGSGLGLSQVYGFVKQSGGHVKIESEQGVGTTVSLYLPLAAAAENALPELPAAELPTGSEHVLVVEDDDLVRDTAEKQLASLGYRVTTAANGPAALDRLSELADVDLLFTDVVMPGMNGRQLADRAVYLNPALKLLFTSGYTQGAMVRRGRHEPPALLLGKPYRKLDLALKIREALDV